MKKYVPLFCFVLSSFSEIQAQKNISLRIDPDNARGGTVSQVFDSIQFIPLETTKESMFGSIDQLEIVDSFFIILDKRSSHSILIFNRDGKFHSKIKTEGVDKFLGYFSVNKKANQIMVINNSEDKLLVYNFNGNLTNKIPYPRGKVNSLYYFRNGNVVYNFRRDTPLEPFDIGYSKDFTHITKYTNRYDPRYQDDQYNIMNDPINFSGELGSCMFSLPLDYTVYQLNDTGIIQKYTFIFPLEYSLPPNFSTDSTFADKRAQYVYRDHVHSKIIWDISPVYKIGNYLLFSVLDLTLKVYGIRNFLYNLKDGNLLSFSRVTGDSSSFYFPFLNTTLDKVEGVFGDKIFTSLPAVRILSLSKDMTEKVNYPQGLNELIKTGTKMNNPVIIQFKLKENL